MNKVLWAFVSQNIDTATARTEWEYDGFSHLLMLSSGHQVEGVLS